jgi:hypothetical protein
LAYTPPTLSLRDRTKQPDSKGNLMEANEAGGADKLRKQHRLRRVTLRVIAAVASVLGTLGVVVPMQPVGAFVTGGRYPVDSWAYNESSIRNTLGQAGIDSLYAMDWAWEVEDLRKWSDLYANNANTTHNIYFAWGDGYKVGYSAYATIGCGSSVNCQMVFDLYEVWNSTYEIRDSSWLDFRSVALHEFGHWIGLDHYWDFPSTDNRVSVMHAELGYGEIRRSIVQDDINGFHGARNYATIISADDSFEYHGWFYWDFHYRVAGQGSGTLYCGGGQGYAGTNCFIEYNGAGNSVYQDMAIRNQYVANGQRSMQGRVRFRNRTGAPAQVTVAVWNLENGTVYSQQTCNLPLDTSWLQCATPYFTSDGRMMRLEAYNLTGGNVDIDTAILG